MGLDSSDRSALNQVQLDTLGEERWGAMMLDGWLRKAAGRAGLKFKRLYLQSLEVRNDLNDPFKATVGVQMKSPEEAFWPNAVERGFGGNPPKLDNVEGVPYILNDLILKGRAFVNVPFSKSAATVKDQALKALGVGEGSATDKETVGPLMAKVRSLKPSVRDGDKIAEYGDRMKAGAITSKLRATHVTDMLDGMIRMKAPYSDKEGSTVKQQPEEGFRIWRRLSATSAPWIHPGFKAQNIAGDYRDSPEFRDLVDKMDEARLEAVIAEAARLINSRKRR